MVGGVGFASRLGFISTDVTGGADTRATPLPYNKRHSGFVGVDVYYDGQYKSVWGLPKRSYSFLCVFDLLYESGEGGGIGDRDLGQNLAVQGDAGFLQTVHKGRIVGAVSLAAGRDTGDPQSAEISLLLLAADESVVTS